MPNSPTTTADLKAMVRQWNDDKLQLAILQVLLDKRKKRPSNGGASGQGLFNCLKLDSTSQLQSAVSFLLANGFIEVSERNFMITANGVDYVANHMGGSGSPNDPPAPSDPPWSPGDPKEPWPPDIDPDDPSRVPLRPKPIGGSTEKMLDLPDVSDLET